MCSEEIYEACLQWGRRWGKEVGGGLWALRLSGGEGHPILQSTVCRCLLWEPKEGLRRQGKSSSQPTTLKKNENRDLMENDWRQGMHPHSEWMTKSDYQKQLCVFSRGNFSLNCITILERLFINTHYFVKTRFIKCYLKKNNLKQTQNPNKPKGLPDLERGLCRPVRQISCHLVLIRCGSHLAKGSESFKSSESLSPPPTTHHIRCHTVSGRVN